MRKGLALIFIVILSACGEEPSKVNNHFENKTQLKSAFSAQLDALKKSKKVEQQMSEAAEKRRIQMLEKGI